MAVSIDISEIFYKAWGYEMPPQQTPQIPAAPVLPATSSLGQAYYAHDDLGREFFTPVYIDDMLIPFAVIGITAKKTIVGTSLPERGGTVHELISIDDYVIAVKGLFITDDNSYPESDVIKLKQLYEKNTSVVMRSVLPAIFLNGAWEEKIIIRELRLNPIAGVQHAVPFDLICESDMAFDLIVQ